MTFKLIQTFYTSNKKIVALISILILTILWSILIKDASMLTALVAVSALVWEFRKNTLSIKRKEEEVKRAAKMKIISDLFEYRFLLIGTSNPDGTLEFNKAIARIPIDFVEHKEVVEKCQELVEVVKKDHKQQDPSKKKFPEKFHDLLNTMYQASTSYF